MLTGLQLTGACYERKSAFSLAIKKGRQPFFFLHLPPENMAPKASEKSKKERTSTRRGRRDARKEEEPTNNQQQRDADNNDRTTTWWGRRHAATRPTLHCSYGTQIELFDFSSFAKEIWLYYIGKSLLYLQ